ncbi:MAG TPA: cytochrome P450 [Pirellulales bacterium]|nr:cytochrome P450 [Pirellulales bacterium]
MTVRPFDIRSQEFKRNPYPALAQMVEQGPLVKVKYPFIGDMWMTTTYEACNELLRDGRNFVRDARSAGLKKGANLPWWMPRSFKAMAVGMINRDPPDHRRLRGLVEQAFLRRSVDSLRPRFEQIVDRIIDDLAEKYDRTGQPVDLVADLARPFPLAVICELLGLPQADRPMFVRHAEAMANNPSWLSLFKMLSGLKRLTTYIRDQVQRVRRTPQEGLISALSAAEQAGDRLTEEEMVAMILLLLFAGHITTVHLIGAGIFTLFGHPSQKQALLADWSLAESAIDEMLRYISPVQMTKPMMPVRDMHWHGQDLKRGENVVAYIAAANVDPNQFPEPERFDILRRPNAHLAFGAGPHICLGLKLAVAETEIALRRLFTRFPNLELAVPIEQVPWSRQLGTRGMASLPVRLA